MNKAKNKIKIPIYLFIVFIIFILTSCDMDEESGEKAYLGTSFSVSDEQVYIRNKDATKISQVYNKYEKERKYNIFVCIPHWIEEQEKFNNLPHPLSDSSGSGNIINGILNYTVSPLEDSDLLEWNNFKLIFKHWDNVTSSSTVKGTMFLLEAFNGENLYGVDRQRITGTGSTITQETLMYVYVNNDCTITGTNSQNYDPGNFYYYTEGNLSLQLKKGWNIISRTETYGVNFSGSAHIGMKIINPIKNPEDYKWVIELGFGF